MARISPADMCKTYDEAKKLRNPFEPDWRSCALHFLPRQYNAWTTDAAPNVTNKDNQQMRRTLYDTTGARALPKYAAVIQRICTPIGHTWVNLQSTDSSLNRNRRVAEYFEELTRRSFEWRYDPLAGFVQGSNEVYSGMGVYGMGPIFVGKRSVSPAFPSQGMLYRPCHMHDIYVLGDDEGRVTHVFRRFYLNARTFKIKFPKAAPPPCISKSAAQTVKSESDMSEFVHVVCVRDDYDAASISPSAMAYSSSFVAVTDKQYVGDEEGFRSMPYLTPRTFTEAGDVYAFSPAQISLAAQAGASATKKTMLKAGQQATDPTILAHDDGVIGKINLKPGEVIYGGVDSQGRKLVAALDRGSNFTVAEELLKDDRADVEDSMFVQILQLLQQNDVERTATEIVEILAEKAATVAPAMGRTQSEFLAPCIQRELEVATELGFLNDLQMPPELLEARGQYKIRYTSPMAKALMADSASGFLRISEALANLSQLTGNSKWIDQFDPDAVVPDICESQAIPVSYLLPPAALSQARQQAAQEQQRQQLMANAAPLANAAQTAQKAGILPSAPSAGDGSNGGP